MSYSKLETKVPSAQDLINLSRAGINAAEYMNLVKSGIEAEVEIVRANVSEAATQKKTEDLQNLRRFYGMTVNAPADLVESYVWRHNVPDSSLFPTYSETYTKLKEEEDVAAMKADSDYPDIPDDVFLNAVRAARRHGVDPKNVKINIHIVEDEEGDFDADRFNPLELLAKLGNLRSQFAK